MKTKIIIAKLTSINIDTVLSRVRQTSNVVVLCGGLHTLSTNEPNVQLKSDGF